MTRGYGPDQSHRSNTTSTSLPSESPDLEVELLDASGCAQWEADLQAASVSMALVHRARWLDIVEPGRSVYVGVRDRNGSARCGFAGRLAPSRALPGHSILSVNRMLCEDVEAAAAGVRNLLAWARADRRILRCHLALFVPDDRTRVEMGRALTALGARPVPLADYRSYTDTLVVDLDRSEEEIRRGLHGTARRHIASVNKRPVLVGEITDAAYAPRIESLMRETMARTDGTVPALRWVDLLEFSQSQPHLSRVVGLFHADESGPESLLAVAVGRNHGEYAQYADAASTRRPDLKMALGYALVWDLICWARSHGCRRFDLGGITTGHHGDRDDPLGGISDFKRFFATDVVRVGEEWTVDLQPFRDRVARRVSRLAQWVRDRRSGG